LLYVPHNTVHQHFSVNPTTHVIALSAHDRLFRLLGYDSVVHFEDALEEGFPEFHHVLPFAAGGASTIENIEPAVSERCRPRQCRSRRRRQTTWSPTQELR
jgi:hypothetical protein